MNIENGRNGLVHASDSFRTPMCGVYGTKRLYETGNPVTCRRCRIMLLDAGS